MNLYTADRPAFDSLSAVEIMDKIVGLARTHRKIATEFLVKADQMQRDHGYQAARGYREDSYRHAAIARWTVDPLREAIKERTIRERHQAETIVFDSAAAFLTPACEGETCGDCDRPLWHHIAILDRGTLCPFGRQFWTLARAFFQANPTVDAHDRITALKHVARRG